MARIETIAEALLDTFSDMDTELSCWMRVVTRPAT